MTTDAAPRPGIASTHLPGAIHELFVTGELPPDTPGLAELAAELPPEWFMLDWGSSRIDQRGWPLRNEAVLACAAAAREPGSPAHAKGWLDVVRRWLRGDATDEELATTRDESVAVNWGSGIKDPTVSDDQALAMYQHLCPHASEQLQARFLDARRRPLADTIAWLAVEAAYAGRDGWLAYYAHRRMTPPAALHAAAVIRAVARAGGVTGAEVVRWARELVAGRDPVWMGAGG